MPAPFAVASFSVSFRDLPPPDDGPAVHVLDLHGELDAHTAPEFENALQACVDQGKTRLVVAGEALRYVSSAGLGVFMAFLEPVRQGGGDLKVAALTEEVHEVFDLLGFPLLFDLAPTAEAAAARFTEADAPEADTPEPAPPTA
ncbi:MAG: STAS domain-containing protein [Bacteroidota bacterium]